MPSGNGYQHHSTAWYPIDQLRFWIFICVKLSSFTTFAVVWESLAFSILIHEYFIQNETKMIQFVLIAILFSLSCSWINNYYSIFQKCLYESNTAENMNYIIHKMNFVSFIRSSWTWNKFRNSIEKTKIALYQHPPPSMFRVWF